MRLISYLVSSIFIERTSAMTVVRQIPSDAVSVVKMCELIIAVDELKYVDLDLFLKIVTLYVYKQYRLKINFSPRDRCKKYWEPLGLGDYIN